MRNIFFLIFLLCCWQIGYSQFPITQNFGGPSTLTLIPPNGGFKASLINRTFTDTTAANLTPIDAYAGSQIFTTSDGALWVRNASATKWLQILSSGASSDTLAWKLGGNDISAIAGYGVLGTTSNDPFYFITNNLKRLGIPETGIVRSADPINKCLTFDTTTKLMYYTDCGSGGGGSGTISRIGTIDSLTKSADGAGIYGNSLFMQTADSSHPGLLTAAFWRKIDSLRNVYWYAIQKSGYLSTAYRPNDSTIYAKAINLSVPSSELQAELSVTDTTGTWTLSWLPQTPYQAFVSGSGGNPAFRYLDSNYWNGNWSAQVRNNFTLTTTGSSGAATYNSTTGVFNIPQYSSGGTPAGNYGNIQLNRNSTFGTPASDTLIYTTSGGFVVKNIVTGNALYLPNSTASTGALYLNSVRWMGNYGAATSNTSIGGLAGSLSTSPQNYQNTAVGYQALSNNNAYGNTAVGFQAMQNFNPHADSLTEYRNAAFGWRAMGDATGGYQNTMMGVEAGLNLQTGSYSNSGFGKSVFTSVTTGFANAAIGASIGTTTGSWNSYVGADIAATATSGSYNAGIGGVALLALTTGSGNSAIGYGAGGATTTGGANTYLGQYAGNVNTTGSSNVMIGYAAGYTLSAPFSNKFSLSSQGSGNALAMGDLNTRRFGINKAENATLAYTLTVGGKAAIETIDSTGTGTAINMLYQDPSDGLIKKAAVPSSGGGTPAGNYGNIQLNRNGAFAVAASDSLGYTTSGGFVAKNEGYFHTVRVGLGTASIATNAVLGTEALNANTTGAYTTSVGYRSLYANTTGSQSTAVGYQALTANTTGDYNTAVGTNSLVSNVSGNNNAAFGVGALQNNTGSNNMAIGFAALQVKTSGNDNVAIGYSSAVAQTTAADNTIVGGNAGYTVTSGGGNTLIGKYAGGGITDGTGNTVIGANLYGLSNTTNNIIIGNGAGTIKAQHDGSTGWTLKDALLLPDITNFADTTTYKPVVINTSTKQLYKATYWPVASTPTLQEVFATQSNTAVMTGANTIDASGNTFSINNLASGSVFTANGATDTSYIIFRPSTSLGLQLRSYSGASNYISDIYNKQGHIGLISATYPSSTNGSTIDLYKDSVTIDARSGNLFLRSLTTGGAAADSVLVITSGGLVKKRNASSFAGSSSITIADVITSATTGSVLYAGTGGRLQQSNAAFFYDSTNKRLGLAQGTPTSRLHLNFDQNSVTQADANGILLANATAAIAGTQSISPGLVWQGNGWKTDATAASQDVRFRADVLPVVGTANPTGKWQLKSSINGAAYATAMIVTNDGIITTDGSTLNTISITATGNVVLNNGGNVAAGGQYTGNGTSTTYTYRTTDAGSDQSMKFVTSGSTTAGTQSMLIGNSVYPGFILSAANGTRQIARAWMQLTNLVNTAGSETGDLVFYTKASASAGAERMRIDSAGKVTFTARAQFSKGSDVASAGDLTLGNGGNTFHITGTTTINAITTTRWQAGSEIILIFDGSVTVKDATSGGANTAQIYLSGSTDLSAVANMVLKLIYDGTAFYEVSRSSD